MFTVDVKQQYNNNINNFSQSDVLRNSHWLRSVREMVVQRTVLDIHSMKKAGHQNYQVVSISVVQMYACYSILFYPITLEGRRGTTDELATIPFHLDLFSAALVELAKSIPVHSLILSSHLFFCLPLFLFPFTVP